MAGKDAAKVEKALDLHTVGDLLGHFPRSYVAKGALSDLGELHEGDFISVFGQVTRSEPKQYQDRRTRRTAYRTEVDIRGSDGRLALTFFDKHANTAAWRATEFSLGRFGLFSGKLKWFNGHWELNNPRAKMYAAEGDASEAYDADTRADPDLPRLRQRRHLADRGRRARRARPRRAGARRAARADPQGAGPARRPHRTDLGAPAGLVEPGQGGPEAAQVRRGVRDPGGARAAAPRPPAPACRAAHRTGRRTAGPLRRAAAVRADRRTARGGGDPGRGPRPAAPDAPPAPGRGRLRQDDGGAAGDAPGGRHRRPGGAAGADRGARPAARPVDPADARAARRGRPDRRRRRRHPGRAADRLDGHACAAAGDARRRQRRGRDRGRHPRSARGQRLLLRPRPGRRRRTAPVRCRAAGGADLEGDETAPRAGDDRDADPAHGRDDRLRRPRHLDPDRAAARPRRRADQRRAAGDVGVARPGLGADPRGGRRRPAGLRRLPADRRHGAR